MAFLQIVMETSVASTTQFLTDFEVDENCSDDNRFERIKQTTDRFKQLTYDENKNKLEGGGWRLGRHPGEPRRPTELHGDQRRLPGAAQLALRLVARALSPADQSQPARCLATRLHAALRPLPRGRALVFQVPQLERCRSGEWELEVSVFALSSFTWFVCRRELTEWWTCGSCRNVFFICCK